MHKVAMILACVAAPVTAQEWDVLDVEGCAQLLDHMVQAEDPDGLDGSALTAETIELEGGYCVFTGVSSTNTREFSIHYDVEKVRVRGQGLERIAEQMFPIALDLQLSSVVQSASVNSDYDFDLSPNYAEVVQNEFLSHDYSIVYVADLASRTLDVQSYFIGLPYDRSVAGSMQVVDIDAAGPAEFEVSFPGASVTEIKVEAQGAGLYEFYVAELFSGRFVAFEDSVSFAEQLIAKAEFVVQATPPALADAQSVAAARAFLQDLPHPTGALQVEIEAEPGLGMARFSRFVLSGPPQSVEEAWPALEGVSISVDYIPDAAE